MSLLNGGMAAIFGAAFGGLYPNGVLHRDGTGPIYDDEGNIVGYDGGGDVPIKVQRDACTYAMRQSEGYADGDVMLIILTSGLAHMPTTDSQVTDGNGDRWMVASVDRDAANSHYVCRGRKA
ncbi:hypothetical protein [Sphingobium sp. ZW T5_29]|uniref:hypothetical protein n=1 Tax=Sphingobium sp. ZW T5_29 TaxID=3378077 RepID=UPI003851ACAD